MTLPASWTATGVEAFIFYDHPSGRTRITAAMRWRAEHSAASPEEISRALFDSK